MNQPLFSTVSLNEKGTALIILDQTLLPGKTHYLELDKIEDIWEAIYKLRVRGAPAIGIAAAYGLYIGTMQSPATTTEELEQDFYKAKDYLATARPTAVNLFWALNRMSHSFLKAKSQGKNCKEILIALKGEGDMILEEDAKVCYNIGLNGLNVLKANSSILTHCNAGALATARYGTALAPIYLGLEKNIHFKVYADETRPLLQGARLTTWELSQAGVDVTLICDNMAASVMSMDKIDAVLVGCDRVAANGDAANKIGTMGVAILAKHFNIPFYVCCPKSTIDLNCATGKDIKIEERPSEEITDLWYSERMAPEKIKTFNPSFDVTDHSLITAFITEEGVIYPPFDQKLKDLFRRPNE